MTSDDLDLEIRPGRPDDVPVLLQFIREMAAFQKLDVTATEESLRSALFGEEPAAHALLVLAAGKPIGYATYYFTFASMTGRRGLWLDDVYLDPAYRGRGLGKAVMAHLAGIAEASGCARFEWIVLDWNTSAIALYERLGATIADNLRFCRMDEDGLQQLARADPWRSPEG